MSASLEALTIDPTGKATYIVQKEHAKGFSWGSISSNSSLSHDSGLTVHKDSPIMESYPIQVRKDLLPPEPLANALLDIYFADIHPYMPVINKSLFYHQWRYERENMSLFLLECMFGTACRLCEGPAIQDSPEDTNTAGVMWYRRALDHLDDFLDCARFTTVQGILILIKCKETMPGDGYYYRGWMMLSAAIRMGIDCGLNKSTTRNRSSPAEKRVWQVVSHIDQLMSTAQGRESQMSRANLDDTNYTADAGDDETELELLNNFTYLNMLIRLLRRATEIVTQWGSGFWPSDPRYKTLSQILESWQEKLPPQLRIQLPGSIAEPFPLPKHHFSVNLQIAFWMTSLLMYRPWLLHSPPEKSTTTEASKHISKAIYAAKAITQYVTAVYQQYGLKHFKYMLRGINFTIYACVAAVFVLIHATRFDSDALAYFHKLSEFLEIALSDSSSAEIKESLRKIRAAYPEYESFSKSPKTMQLNPMYATPGYGDPNVTG
ncbi:Cutinase transcription factor 1 alpha [Neolecta irregularis DAH-3]|uniref:Cutinase transcription factor 1 alpha n=1 Tax=Neolecta irregularis (strain DAH-3) TaxID=1198029 RepID=A0A1U7LS71_NEOID|nr:Cutinase transcription factor 1 alpha [Neolecta irregularis DAH-3]|eukprot:OLL25468.1 Cutinase transcription factor 1 alpha [Neolecta irregularis DAH-3]